MLLFRMNFHTLWGFCPHDFPARKEGQISRQQQVSPKVTIKIK
jgi:hypothetical protein